MDKNNRRDSSRVKGVTFEVGWSGKAFLRGDYIQQCTGNCKGAGGKRGPKFLCVFTALQSAADVNGSTENKNWWCGAESAAATAASVREAVHTACRRRGRICRLLYISQANSQVIS